MKRLATILMLIAALLVGGMTMDAKTTKKTKVRTSSTTKKTASNAVFKFRPYSDGDYVTVYKNAKGKYSVKGEDFITVKQSNGAYIVEFVPWYRHGAGVFGLVYNGKFYKACSTMSDDNYPDTTQINSFMFNPSSMTISYINFDNTRITLNLNKLASSPATIF